MWAKVKEILVTGWKTHSVIFARVNTFVGVVFGVLVATDLSPIISDPKVMVAWIVFSGTMMEMSRRFKSDDVE